LARDHKFGLSLAQVKSTIFWRPTVVVKDSNEYTSLTKVLIQWFQPSTGRLLHDVNGGADDGGAGKLFKCYDYVEKYFPRIKVKNA
jgi:hypothetical protein